jgi:nucleoside-diphosphate-sugar epimerase
LLDNYQQIFKKMTRRPWIEMGKFCVVGASGFVGSHLVKYLLANGHEVNATVRNVSNSLDEFFKSLPQDRLVQ